MPPGSRLPPFDFGWPRAGLAAASKLPLKFVKGIQMLYELQTFMPPIVNITRHNHTASLPPGLTLPPPEGWEALARIPWRGPGCTGIIAKNKKDGTVRALAARRRGSCSPHNRIVCPTTNPRGGRRLTPRVCARLRGRRRCRTAATSTLARST